MNPVEIVEEQFKVAGLQAQYKRRCKDGTLEDATEKELQVLKVQSQIATAAQQLKQISPAERTEWAIEIKDYANALYMQGFVTEAMDKYTEALAASDFSKETGNVDTLVLPILCNLAACCIQIEKYGKGVRFADQALNLDPECCKAQMRKGICFFHLGEFSRASVCLRKALLNFNADCQMIHDKLELDQQEEICVTVGVDDDKSDDDADCDSSELDGKHDENDYYDLHSTHDINDHNYDVDKIDKCDDIKNHNNDSTPHVDDGIIHRSSRLESDDGHDDNRDDTTKAISPSTSAINSQTAITNTKNKIISSINVPDQKLSQADKNQSMKDKILSYIMKAQKKIEIEKSNQIRRKKAMQKVFSPIQQTSNLTSTLEKDMKGIKKNESSRQHQLRKKNIFIKIVDLIYFLFCFFMSPFTKKKD